MPERNRKHKIAEQKEIPLGSLFFALENSASVGCNKISKSHDVVRSWKNLGIAFQALFALDIKDKLPFSI